MLSNLSFLNQRYAKYFKNTAWLLMEKGLRILDAFFIGIWLARYLGPEQFGILSYAESMVYLFTAVAAMGLDQIVVRELVKDAPKQNEILGTTFVLRIIGFAIMLVLLWGTLQLLNNDTLTNSIVLIIACSVFFKSFSGIDYYFQSKIHSKYVVITNSIAVGVAAVAKVSLIITQADLINFAYVYVGEAVLIALGLLLSYSYKKLSALKWKFSLRMSGYLLRKSWFLIIGAIAAALYFKIDQVMIKEILDERAVGLYSVAVKLSSIWLFVTVAITQSVFPTLVALRKRSRKEFLERLQQLYDLLMKIAIVVSVLYTIFANFIVTFLFGNEYAESVEVVIIYIWSIVFVFLSNGSWSYYLNENLEKFASLRLIIGAVINIALNIYFIELYGLTGAAYATLISYSISGYFVNYLFKSTRANFYLQTYSLLHFFNIRTWIKPF
ncbi:flippase [Altibacter sp.]|uniref:flippase n=1 Tax=Altibacter sp. TaxID=2024823 RepID=UPI000C8E471D|nr:flippase [Altibacter sp.]MAP54381.1 O-unit flippase [Altibacter sp.]